MADKWNPDWKFLEFLEWLEKRDGEAITLNGKRVIEEMKQGTEFGKKIHEHLYKDKELQKAYQAWKKNKK